MNHDSSSIQLLENYVNDYSLTTSPSRVDRECGESLRQHLRPCRPDDDDDDDDDVDVAAEVGDSEVEHRRRAEATED